ncbi:amino acid adenylation domain-containing protein [Streptomyces sp. JNUCC 64]
MVEHRAALTPWAMAVRTTTGDRLTYAQLHRRAVALAGRLTARGVRPGQHVVLRVRRGTAFVVSCLAVMRAGAVCVAVDREWPPARVRHVIDTAGAHLLTDEDGDGFPAAPAPGRRRFTPGPSDAPGRVPPETPPPPVLGTDPCMVFFTSGSTGEPKGSVTPHQALVHRFVGVDYADFGPGRVVLQAAPVCWDAMTIELWSVLMNGGTSILLDEDSRVTPRLLRGLVRDEGLDTLWLTAALFNALMDDDPGCLSGTRQVLTGGERLSVPQVNRFKAAHPKVRLVNGYGPVETTVFATTRTVQSGDAERYGQIPLGTPLPRTTVHVLTPEGTPAPPGEPGEICVGGTGLALGYLGRPDLTRERFVVLPSGERVYRTGDIGWRHPDGVLLYGGREDRQVKIRGQRVEPGELERCLEGVDTVRQAVVTVVRDGAGTPVGLAAHCLVHPGRSAVEEARAVCATRLPPYLRPAWILDHGTFPLTASGKVDLRALELEAARARRSASTTDEGPASGPLAACLAEATALLACPVGPDDDLVALGTDSLLAMRLVSRLERRHRLHVPFGAVRSSRTPRRIIARARPLTEPEPPDPPHSGEVADSRLDLWLRERFSPGDPAQLLVSSFEVRPAVDTEALGAALRTLAARHPALRTRYLPGDGPPRAEVGADPGFPVLPAPAPPPQRDGPARCPAEWLAPFDLEAGTPARCLVSPLPDGSLVTLVVHHIAYDGWSEHVFLSELGAAYAAARAGTAAGTAPGAADGEVRRPPPTGPERARARDRWRELLKGTAPLPLPPGDGRGDRIEETRIALDAGRVRALLRATAADDPHLAAVTWYGRALHRCTGVDRFAVGSYFAGRETAGEDAVGYFVRPVPVPLDFASGATPATVAAEAGRYWSRALELPALPLEALADLAPRPSRFGLPPVFQAALAFQNLPTGALRLEGHHVRRRELLPPAAPLPLALQIRPGPDGGWDVRLQCDPTLVHRSVLPRLAGHLTDAFPFPPS